MKRLLSLLLCLVLLCGLAACGKQPEDDPTAPTETTDETTEPVSADKAARRMITLPYTAADALNPFQTKSTMNRDIDTLLYDSLVRLDENFAPVPSLAADVTQNGLTITVTLREDVRFTSGELLHPRDVVYSFQCAKESPCFEARLQTFFSCSQEGETAVVFTLLEENARAASCLDFPVVRFGTGDRELPVGCGRYRPVRRSGDLYLKANEESSAMEEMELQTIKLLDISTRENELQLLQIGELSAFYVDGAAPTQKIFANEQAVPLLNFVYLGLNSGREHLSDPAFRRALAFAIDKPTICAAAYDAHASAADLPFHPLWEESPEETVGYDPLAAPRAFDLLGYTLSSSAKRAKGGQSVKLELVCNSENPMRLSCAKLIADQLRDCGFTVNLSVLDYDSYLIRLESGLWDLYVGEVKLTADMDLSLFFGAEGKAGYGLDPASAAAQTFFSWRAGAVDTSTFAQVFLQDQPLVPLCFRSGRLYCAKELQIEGDVNENDLYANLYAWSYIES
ncbi:MAG: hypothetical protein II621_02415 [Clostridia bacterium]|jgi:peptide/nickel transport system substrate-binding protein|nr:hypothetical protein [Clostridia bacterium]MBQ4366357.1 hypothetical protein [Clostridia bacterium]MBR3095328.1 hypothetical protein [Clostridia bacterium]